MNFVTCLCCGTRNKLTSNPVNSDATNEGFSLSDTRLGFRPFSVVKHHQRDLLLTDYLAAHPPISRSLFTDYLAANSTVSLDSSSLMLPEAVRATMGTRFLHCCTSPPAHGFQQPTADKVPSSELYLQQHFLLTPSELIALLLCRESVVADSPEESGVITSLEAASETEVTQ